MFTIRFPKIWLVLLIFPLVTMSAQTTVDVKTGKELRNAVAVALPGTTILLSDGVYDFDGELKISIRAGKDKPMTIAAKHQGKATVVGDSRFVLVAAEHIVIEGLNFQSTNGPAIELRACSYVRVSRNSFHLKETKRGSWILIDGIRGDSVRLSHHNRVDHNTFERKSQLGNFITVEGTIRTQPQVSQHDRIDHNLFADIGPRVENVLEAIRIGSSTYTLSSGFTVLEDNLFERCDGDPEYISIKSSDNTIRRNTFRECLGSLSLRHGNRSTVDGNFILGNNRTGTFRDSTGKTWTLGAGGVRFCGDGMLIVNNYLEGLTGREWDATFAIINGNAEYGDGQPLTKHFRILDATIASNILVNNASNLEIGYDGGGFQGNWWHLPPKGMRFENNIIVGNQDTLIKIFAQPLNTSWKNNIAWPTGGAVVARSLIDGVRVLDPQLVKTGEIWDLPDRPVRHRPLERSDVGPESGLEIPDVLLVSGSALRTARETYRKNSKNPPPSLLALIEDAKSALSVKPVSVVQKDQLPPSGDKHDYFSLAPYWWPDSTKKDGLPYIRRDGVINPERYKIGDREKIGVLNASVYSLSLAYYITGDETFAAHAVRFLRTWFLNPDTRMNPNLTYAQAVKGQNQGRGTGIIDTHGFIRLIDGMKLLHGSINWTKADEAGMKRWFEQYWQWLRESTNGKEEAAAKNNHGSTYDVQSICFALLIGKEEEARQVLREAGKKRIAVQVERDGSQPLELVRTKAYNYSLMNLEALINLAHLGERLGVDLWSYEAPNGGSIRKAIEFLTPYALGKKVWEWKQIIPAEYERMIPILRLAAKRYNDPSYSVTAEAIEQKIGASARAVLSFPVD